MLCPRCHGSKNDPEQGGACPYCRGSGVTADVRISRFFMLSEFVRSDVAARHGIPNEPDDVQAASLRHLAVEVLDPLRELLGPMRITSGLRRPAVNSIVGGDRFSDHMYGRAADVLPLACSLREAMQVTVDSKLPFRQAIFEFGHWLHVSWRPEPTREALMIFKAGHYEPWDVNDPRVTA